MGHRAGLAGGTMSNFSWVPMLLWGIVIVAGFWPGAEPVRPLDTPKKGYWTVATVFWPMRRAYHDLWPHSTALGKGQRGAWLIALEIAVLATLASDLLHLAKVMSPGWMMLIVGAVAFFLGRASGFWSADRRLRKDPEKPGGL